MGRVLLMPCHRVLHVATLRRVKHFQSNLMKRLLFMVKIHHCLN